MYAATFQLSRFDSRKIAAAFAFSGLQMGNTKKNFQGPESHAREPNPISHDSCLSSPRAQSKGASPVSTISGAIAASNDFTRAALQTSSSNASVA